MSTRLGAAPRTPTNNDRRTKIRRFGTVLSVNSPVIPPSQPKNQKLIPRIRGDTVHHSHLTTIPSSPPSRHFTRTDTIPEENEEDVVAIPFHLSERTNTPSLTSTTPLTVTTTYTVTFDAGPIGLQIDPETWCVQKVIGHDSPAAMIGTIKLGDTVIAVNGISTSSNGNNEDDIFDVLQDVTTRRKITFQRQQEGSESSHPNGDSHNVAPSLPPEATAIVPTNDVENRKPIPGTARLQLTTNQTNVIPAPRSLHFGNHQDDSNSPRKMTKSTTTTAITSTLPIASTKTSSNKNEAQNELVNANTQIQQLQMRLANLEAENERLRNQPQEQRFASPPPSQASQQQPFTAIREMEYNMRIKSLEDELKVTNESKAKIKEHNKRINQMLVHQAENHQQLYTQKEKELQDAILSSKETMNELELTRKELMTTTKQWNDDVNALTRGNDQLKDVLDQRSIELERHIAAKVQSDVRIQQLEVKCSDFHDQVQKLRYKVDEAEYHDQQTNDEFLHIIRTKDEEMEQVRIDMVNVQTTNDKLHTDLTEKDAAIRQARADMEQLVAAKQSMSTEVMNLSSTLEMTYNEKERLILQLTQSEAKLTERNNTIDTLKGTIKSMQDETTTSLALRDDALTTANELLKTVTAERDQLQQQMQEMQVSVQSKNQNETQLQSNLTAMKMELRDIRKSHTMEKCNLLKQMELLEGELITCQTTIQNQNDTILESSVHLKKMTSERDAALSELDLERANVLLANSKIKDLKDTIETLNEHALTKENEYKASAEQLESQIHVVTQEMLNLQASNQSLYEEIAAQRKSLISACMTELRLRSVQNQQRTKIAELEQRRQDEQQVFLTELQSLRAELSSKNDTLTSTTFELNAALTKVVTMDADIALYTGKLALIEYALEAAIIQNVQAEVQYQTFAEAAHMDQQGLKDKLALSEGHLQNAFLQCNELRSAKEKLIVELENENEKAKEQTEEIVKLTTQLGAATTSLVGLEESTRREKDELYEKIQTTAKELEETKQALENSERSHAESVIELDSSRTIANTLSLNFSNLQDRFHDYQSTSEEDHTSFMLEKKLMEQKVQDLTSQLNDQASQLSHIESQLRDANDEVNQLCSRLKMKDEILSENQSEIQRMKAMFETVSGSLQIAEDKLLNMTLRAESSELTIVTIKESMALQQDELGTTSKLVTKLEAENDNLMTEISRMNTEIAQMTSELQQLATSKQTDDVIAEELKQSIMEIKCKYDTDCATKDLKLEEATRERDEAVLESFMLRELIESGKDRQTMLQSEVDQLRDQLINAEADFQKSDELFSGQASELEKFHRKFIEQKTRADKLLLELQQSESSIDSLSRMLDGTNAQVASLKQALASKTKEFEIKLDATKAELSSSLNINVSLTNKNNEFSEIILKLETAYSNAKETADILNRKLSNLESKFSVTLSTATANENEFILKQELLEREISTLHSDLEARDKRLLALKEEMGVKENRNAKLSNQLTEISNELMHVTNSVSSLHAQLDASKQHETAIVAKINESWKSKLDDISEKNRILLLSENEKLDTAENELSTLRSTYEETLSESKLLKLAVCELEARIEVLSKNVATYELDLVDSNERLKVSEAQVVEKMRLLSIAESTITEANTKKSELEKRIENLLLDSSVASNYMAAEFSRLHELSELSQVEHSKLEIFSKALQKRLSDTEFELQRVREELRTQTEKVNGLTASSAASQWMLECKIEALNTEASKYRELSSDLNSECNALKSELDTVNDKVESLNEQRSSLVSDFENVKSKMIDREQELEDKLSMEINRALQLTDELHKLKLNRDRELNDAASNKRQLDENIRLLHHEATLKLQRQEDWAKDREFERAQFHQCREDLEEANVKVSRLDELLFHTKSEVESLQMQVTQAGFEYESNLEDQSRLHAAEISVIQADNNTLLNDIKEISSDRHSLAERYHFLEDQFAALQSEQNIMIAEKKVLLSSIDEKDALIHSLQSELKDLCESSLEAASVDSPLKSLSKSELRYRCSVFQDELTSAELRLKTSNDTLNRRSDHVAQLTEDLNAMSTEISRLIAANELLEARIDQISALYAASEESITTAHTTINGLQAQLTNRLEKFEEATARNESLVDQLQVLSVQSKSARCSLESEKNLIEGDLIKTKQNLKEAISRLDRNDKSLSNNHIELASLRKNEESLLITIKQREEEIQKLNVKFSESTKESNTELIHKVSYYDEQISKLESERAMLRSRVTELQLEIESNEIIMKEKAERERLLTEDVARQRQSTLAAERQREGIMMKLTEASRVVASQRAANKKLESTIADSDLAVTKLKDHIVSLKSVDQKREIKSLGSESQNVNQIPFMKTKLIDLDEKGLIATQDAHNSRAELLKVQRELTECKRATVSLLKQLKDLTTINEFSKVQLADVRNARDDAAASLCKIRNELDSKQMEIDHLKAKVQVSSATATRLKANVLLQESNQQKENDSAVKNETEEIEKLKAELKERSLKLIAISELYKSQDEALSHFQTMKSQLVRFVEEIISEMDNVLGNIALRTESLYEHTEQYQIYDGLKALDLAGFDRVETNTESLRSTLDNLSVLIPRAATQLDERRAQLGAWKEQRSDHNYTTTTTPSAKCLNVVPVTPEIHETLHRLRNFLKTDILSPIKIRTSHSDQLDVEFFKQVIYSLERNIEVLLLDLQTANTAIQEKDDRISELETFIALRESAVEEAHLLSNNQEINNQRGISLNNESDSRDERSHTSQQANSDFDGRKRAAGRLLLHALEGRTNAAKAVAFRRWSCQTSAMRAIAKHGHTATALAQQLEETREKLLILKRHLKKARRAGGGSNTGSIRGDVGTLDRIPEDENEL